MNRLNTLHARFCRHQDGTITIVFGLILFVVCVLVGVGVDGSRAMVSRTRTTEALDAATLAATRALMAGQMTDHEVDLLAIDYFNKSIYSSSQIGTSYNHFHVSIDHTTKTVKITVNAQIPTTFGRFANVDSIDYRSVSEATYNVNDIELGLVLDTTGSMNDPSNSGTGKSKIEELKAAASNMFDTMLPDNGSQSDVRIGIAPFSAAVNAGPYAALVTNNKSKDGCAVERAGADAWTDADASVPGQELKAGVKTTPDIDPTEGLPTDNKGNPTAYYCPQDTVLPLTNDKQSLKDKVNGFKANYWTAGHLGTQWGWYLVSPNWGNVWPAASAPKAYGTKNLVKAIVVMTDGIYNTAYNNNDTSANQAITLCNNAKAQGIVVYTVGFTSPKGAEATLKACATADPHTGEPYYYHAESQAELTAAFNDIAVKLGQLRLSM